MRLRVVGLTLRCRHSASVRVDVVPLSDFIVTVGVVVVTVYATNVTIELKGAGVS